MTPDELLAVELEVVAAVAQEWTMAVAAAHKAILILIAGVEGNDMSEIVPQIQRIIGGLTVPRHMNSEAFAGIIKAHIFGAKLAEHAMSDKMARVELSKSARKAVEGLQQSALTALQDTKKNLAQPLIGGGAQSVTTAIAPVIQNPAKVAAATAWAVNAASNSAVAKIAKDQGEVLCWIGERDGCVHCQAHNGVFSSDSGVFPDNLTFGNKPLKVYGGTLFHPPLHPHCRCHVEINVSPEYADALKREAVRSILKGIKLPSESDKVRLDAARKLLDEDPVAPASVKKYSERAIKRGKFA